MKFQENINEGFVKKIQPDIIKAKSLIKSGEHYNNYYGDEVSEATVKNALKEIPEIVSELKKKYLAN